jgi:hypothetical protein
MTPIGAQKLHHSDTISGVTASFSTLFRCWKTTPFGVKKLHHCYTTMVSYSFDTMVVLA